MRSNSPSRNQPRTSSLTARSASSFFRALGSRDAGLVRREFGEISLKRIACR
jgi:hypothetical protein